MHKGLRHIRALPAARRDGGRGCSADRGGASSVSCGGAGDFRRLKCGAGTQAHPDARGAFGATGPNGSINCARARQQDLPA